MPIFAFTDIEGSTGMWEKYQDAMGSIIARHYDILHLVVEGCGGKIIKKTGDGIFALFPDGAGDKPSSALECALDLQRCFQGETWPVIGELRVRIALHCGQAEEMAGDYYGPTANRTARLMSLAWGGQILVSQDLYRKAKLPEGAHWEDLGLHQVKDLPEPQQVYGLLHPSLKLQEFPALKSLSNRPNNLPEQLSPFVGRRQELRELAVLLTSPHSRLTTLLGGGGMGKTRLAIQGAMENLAAFKHGVNLVSLAGLVSPEALPARIAESLKIAAYKGKDPKDQVLEYLRDKVMLLILDPCEGLGGGSAWVSELLTDCAGLRVLACSRRRLRLQGETVLELKGLDYPAEVSPEGFSSGGCARFFVQQVQGFQPGYSLRPEERAFFLRICRTLRGMPLGLELAAGWLRSLPMKVLADRLDQDPRFLVSDRQDLPASHRSLQSLFSSAWISLSEPERRALAQLTVFGGTFLPLAVQQTLKVAPETLSALADQSLLEAVDGGRLVMPASTRFFAATKLEEDPARRDEALDLHARLYCRLLKERERNLLGYEQAKAVAELRQDFPNLQRAWDRAVEKGWGREIGQAARSLGLFTDMQGLAREWEPRLERALQLWERAGGEVEGLNPEESMTVQASLLASRANFLFSLGKGTAAREAMEKSLSLSRKAGHRAGAAYALVRTAVFLGPEDERRVPALMEAASLYQALNDANGAAWARRNLGYLLCLQGRAAEGQPMVEESLAVFRKVGNQREIAWSLNSLGQLALERGEASAGAQGLREARDIFLGLGDRETAAWTLSRLGRAYMKQSQWDEARAAFEESLQLFGQIRHFRGRAQAMRGLCELFMGQGDLATAFQILDKSIAEAQAAGDLSGQAGSLMQKAQMLASQQRYEEALALMQAAQAAFAKAGSDPGQALALEGQANANQGQGQRVLARRLFEEAGQAFNRAGMPDGEARVFVRLGDLDAAEAKPQGGEAYYKRALKLSRLNKPGDYSVGALLGLAGVFHKAGRKLEALHLGLVCERLLASGMMPASEPEFFAELKQRSEAALSLIGGKLLHSVVDEARAKLSKEDARGLLKECIEKNWS